MAVNVEKFKKRILAEKERLVADRSRLMDHNGESASERAGDLVDFDMNHPGEAGSELFEREKDEALNENIDGMLSLIEASLQKIEDGTYGKCDRCAKAITEARLEALPYAVFCIDCQSRVEGARGRFSSMPRPSSSSSATR